MMLSVLMRCGSCPQVIPILRDKRAQKVLPPEVRYEMVCEAAADNPHFTPSDFEIHRQGNTYTCDTLRELREQNPQNHYYFIVGADSIRDILTWRNPESIFADCTLLAALREDGIPTEEFLAEVRHLKGRVRGGYPHT